MARGKRIELIADMKRIETVQAILEKHLWPKPPDQKL